jgi:hypothetical protein
MGWNSWDSFGTTVTEAEVEANADYMATNLAKHGWQYVVVDIQWAELNPQTHGYRPNAELAMDSHGRLIPSPKRFLSSVDGRGFKPLAEYVHGKGLKFGLHIMRGIPRRAVDANLPIFGSKLKAAEVANKESVCRWNTDMYGVDTRHPGGQDYYDSILKLYSSWGVDFIKADNMLDGDHGGEIEMLSKAIGKTSRPMVLSLSPGPARLADAEFLAKNAQMWRVSDDFWDRWADLKGQLPRLAAWARHVKPGGWPDGDMLPLGHIGIRAERGDPRMSLLTHNEQTMLITMWSIARSPLMFGGHLPDNDAFTLSLLNNDEVLEANQKGTASRQLFARGNQVAWISELGGARFLAVCNVGDTAEEEVRVNWSEIGMPRRCSLRDLWAKEDLGVAQEGRSFRLAPHASGFYKVTAAPR